MWYLCRRGIEMLLILAFLSMALFALLSAMPGNPIDLLITSNPAIKPEDVMRLKKLRGLDKPWYVQYYRWIWGYNEPARPPVILSLPTLEMPSDAAPVMVNLQPYLVDPNFEPSEAEITKWLTGLWPEWGTSFLAPSIKKYIHERDLSQLLLTIAQKDIILQNQLVKKIDAESALSLQITGLLGTKAEGLSLLVDPRAASQVWFKVKNSYGQEKIGRIQIGEIAQDAIMQPISARVVEDESKPFELDLQKFVRLNEPGISFRLLAESAGHIDSAGHYNYLFNQAGQTSVLLEAEVQGKKEVFSFDIEHGAIGRENRFNRGFLFFFAGDKMALGFSQTYKRPVYELLFGADAICGNKIIDSSETCDDGNLTNGDGCDETCQKESDTFFARLDTRIKSFIQSSGRIGNTVQLMIPALLLSLLIALPLGIFSAYRQYSWLDYVVNFLAFIGISLPVFWFGIMMVYLFAEHWQFFPAGGVETPGLYGQTTWGVFKDRFIHAILPTLVLAIFYVGRWLRYMRASMLEVLPKDYIRTARAKGLGEKAVILKHAFRNALIPVVTVLAISIPALFGGAVLTETVFSWPGVGRMQYDAVLNSDYYVAIVVFLMTAMLVMIGNLIADAVYVLVDPRIRKN